MSEWTLVHDRGPGWGHERRMRALARSLESRGAAVVVRPLADDPVRAARLVIDSYAFRADDRERFEAERIVAFEDLGRDLAVDLLVAAVPGADAGRHPSASAVLAGAPYAVIDPAVRELEPRPPARPVERVLVSFGAADLRGLASTVAGEIAQRLPEARVELPVGPWWDGPVPDGVEAVSSPGGLAPRLAGAGLAVIAGGVTLLEALALARPAVAIEMAENQRTALEHAAAAGAVVRSEPGSAAGDAAALAADAGRRVELAASAGRLIDGRGAARVADAVLALGD